MSIELDHFIVPCKNQVESARRLAELLGVPWEKSTLGGFSPVYLNDGLTLDFQQTSEPYPVAHYCFRVSQAQFDAILARLQGAGIAYRSRVSGPVDMKSNQEYGGDMVYWNEPDGHLWEMLTVSYARKPS
ncbi:VOC family protein [Massilia sp. R2A-15]|uniref:VOC family protein n=1 Tax=Massilia sp. R2A-15 TaxID=3064278 RepID=UPI002733E224|nr:VOC family protein [Massilia sp. R2A-15]WLI87441.1 VOC family protein [Massilia sp. R2A-15]